MTTHETAHPQDTILPPTPFLAAGDLATVAPEWARALAAAEDVPAAARAFFDAHPTPVEGPAHVIRRPDAGGQLPHLGR